MCAAPLFSFYMFFFYFKYMNIKIIEISYRMPGYANGTSYAYEADCCVILWPLSSLSAQVALLFWPQVLQGYVA